MASIEEQMRAEDRRRKDKAAADAATLEQPGPTQAKYDLQRAIAMEDYRRELMKRNQAGESWLSPPPIVEHGATLGLDVPLSGLAAGLDFWNGGDLSFGERYQAGEQARRDKLQTAGAEAVVPPLAQEMFGAAASMPVAGALAYGTGRAATMPVVEQGALRTAAEGAGIGGGAGFIHGASTGEGGWQDRLMQGLKEGAIGTTGTALLGGALQKTGSVLDYATAAPDVRAQQAIYELARRNGLTPAGLQAAIQRVGPEALTIDVLGEAGRGAARAAANTSPEAREVMTQTLAGRRGLQNERLVATQQQAAGLPPGDRRTVDNIVEQSYAARRPAIDAAYTRARSAGQELPDQPFRDVLETPMGRGAYEAAGPSLQNRRAFTDDSSGVAGALARLDQTKRELDAIAATARRGGDNNRAAQAEGLASLLRQRIDETMAANPVYAEARGLRQAAFREEEAIRAGETIAGRPGIGGAAEAQQYTGDPAELAGLRAGHAQTTADILLNKNSGAAAIDRMTVPSAVEARQVIYGPNAGVIDQGIAREREMALANQAVSGNSTTARQMIEAGVAGGGLPFALDQLLGTSLSPYALATAGLGAAGRYLGPRIQQTMRRPVETAAALGRQMVQRPAAAILQRAIDPGFLSRLAGAISGGVGRLGTLAASDFMAPAPVEMTPPPAPEQPLPVDEGMLDPKLVDPRDILRRRGLNYG